jgi:hypothetical protein
LKTIYELDIGVKSYHKITSVETTSLSLAR